MTEHAGGSDARNSEVPEKPVRRRFDAAYKLRILEEADRCTEADESGQLLRREGLYSSHLSSWSRQREEGSLEGLRPTKRGRRARRKDPLVAENQQLRRNRPIRTAARPENAHFFRTLRRCGDSLQQRCPGATS